MTDGTTADASNLRKQMLILEKKLAQALCERDDLARDVEALCMETTANTSFSSSSVLRERIFATGMSNTGVIYFFLLTFRLSDLPTYKLFNSLFLASFCQPFF
jgi:hypothetical protein